MGSILKNKMKDGGAEYHSVGSVFVSGYARRVDGYWNARVTTTTGTTECQGYFSPNQAEAQVERMLACMGHAVYAPLDTSTPANEPTPPEPKPDPNSIEIKITALTVSNELRIEGFSVVDVYTEPDWSNLKKIARLGNATLTFHNN